MYFKFKYPRKWTFALFLFMFLTSSVSGMEKDEWPSDAVVGSGSLVDPESEDDNPCPEGWAWRKDFKIIIDGVTDTRITKQINDLHLGMARNDQWAYTQIKDKKGQIQQVNVAFAAVGVLFKGTEESPVWSYVAIPLLDIGVEQKERVFLSGKAFSSDIRPSLEPIRRVYAITEPNLEQLMPFIQSRMSKDKDSMVPLMSASCLHEFQKELTSKTGVKSPKDVLFDILKERSKDLYHAITPSKDDSNIAGYIGQFKEEIQKKIAAGRIENNHCTFNFIFSTLEDNKLDENPFSFEDLKDIDGMIKFLTQLESAFKKSISINNEDIRKKIGEWIGNCKSTVVRMKASISEPKVTSDEFTGHTEQNVLYYLNNDPSFLESIKATIRKKIVEKYSPVSFILHIHSRLDVCERCAPSIARELEFVRDREQSSVFSKVISFLKDKYRIQHDIFFNILVSTRHPYKERDSGEEGYRRRMCFDGDHEGFLELLKDHDKYYMKAIGTFPPN